MGAASWRKWQRVEREREQKVEEVELRRAAAAAGNRVAKNDVRGGRTRGEI